MNFHENVMAESSDYFYTKGRRFCSLFTSAEMEEMTLGNIIPGQPGFIPTGIDVNDAIGEDVVELDEGHGFLVFDNNTKSIRPRFGFLVEKSDANKQMLDSLFGNKPTYKEIDPTKQSFNFSSTFGVNDQMDAALFKDKMNTWESSKSRTPVKCGEMPNLRNIFASSQGMNDTKDTNLTDDNRKDKLWDEQDIKYSTC